MTPDELREVLRGAVARALAEAACLPEDIWRSSLPEATAALAAIRDVGYAIVPVEPTEAMISAYFNPVGSDEMTEAKQTWTAMLKEAQEGKP